MQKLLGIFSPRICNTPLETDFFLLEHWNIKFFLVRGLAFQQKAWKFYFLGLVDPSWNRLASMAYLWNWLNWKEITSDNEFT